MQNIITYTENELATFSKKSFNSVDSLVLSQFSYIHLPLIVPGLQTNREPVGLRALLKTELFPEMFNNVRDYENNRKLLFAMAASPRFRDIKLSFYADEKDDILEKQFSAVTLFLDEETAYIAFRGTDATLVGWKEDFNMAFKCPVPAQEAAVRYVEEVARRCHGQLMLGGHSKGGNLAVYAYAKCSQQIKERITKVYSHDGPGFKENIIDSIEFQCLHERVEKTLPQSSVIGMLLENQERYSIVKSNRTGVMQHDPFSWIVKGDHFVIVEQLTKSAKYMDRSLHQWLGSISDDEREHFVNALYSVLDVGDTKNVSQIGSDWQRNIPLMLNKVTNLDEDSRILINKTLKAMAATALKNIPGDLPPRPAPKDRK